MSSPLPIVDAPVAGTPAAPDGAAGCHGGRDTMLAAARAAGKSDVLARCTRRYAATRIPITAAQVSDAAVSPEATEPTAAFTSTTCALGMNVRSRVVQTAAMKGIGAV